jgi:uncharacterized secreted protein with C-terminal beta-propeller domain
MQLRRKTNIASMNTNRLITAITITITTIAITITTITIIIITIAITIGRIDQSARLLGSRAMRARLYRMKRALQILPGSAIGSRNG